MLVVISDMHFEEERSDYIEGEGVTVGFSRNTPGHEYYALGSALASEARRNGAQKMDLVLAGDLFDLHRTTLWFEGENRHARPYVPDAEVDASVEAKILEIISAIVAEPDVEESFAALRLLASGRYREDAGGEGEEREFPIPVEVHYIPGNHDRLTNATPAIRRRVRGLLGLGEGEQPFPYSVFFDNPRVLVRHGHEYDPYNHSVDHTLTDRLPVHLPDEEYENPSFGDFITTEVAVRFPKVLRRVYGDGEILKSRILATIYRRLLEFDDLRPQSALLNFLLSIPDEDVPEGEVWSVLSRVARQILEEIHDNPFLRGELRKMNKKGPHPVDAVEAYLNLKAWRPGIPLTAARLYTRYAVSEETSGGPAVMAARESVVQDGSVRFVIAGHTHHPQVALLAAGRHGGSYYVDTGTWRNRIPATPLYDGFGRLRTTTYAIIYRSDENAEDGPGPGGLKTESFSYWSGFSQTWSEEEEHSP